MPIAEKIITDCTPVDQEPEEVVVALRFTRHLDSEGAEDRLEKAQRLHDIAALVQHVETDAVEIRNARFRQSFEIAESYQVQYLTTPDYGLALHYLRRLFVLREYALAQLITRHNGNSEVLGDFSIILRQLIEEL